MRRGMFCILGGVLAGSVSAQPTDATLRATLDAMNSEHLAEREAAELSFANIPGILMTHIESLAHRADLSPEQIFRLRQAARRLFEHKPMAGMGVQFQGFSEQGVVIGETIEGFHAAEVLEPMDTIVHCNGDRMRTQDDLRWAILSREPGETLTLDVLRAGQMVRVEVRLGSFDSLPNALSLTPTDVAKAFAARWARTVEDPLAAQPVIGGHRSVEEWARVEAGEPDEDRPAAWTLTRDSASRMVAFGGRPRSALSIRQALADYTGPADPTDPTREQVSTIADIVDQMRALNRQKIIVDQRAQTLERHADMVADPARQQQLIEMRSAALQEIVTIDAELAMLREALRVMRERGRE